MAPSVAPTGIVICTFLSFKIRTGTLRAAPIHASVTPVNPLPFTVTTVPGGPPAGEKLLMSGCTSVLGVVVVGGGGVVGVVGALAVRVNQDAVNAVWSGLKMPIAPFVAPEGTVTLICV